MHPFSDDSIGPRRIPSSAQDSSVGLVGLVGLVGQVGRAVGGPA
jgi:hypothetical protein